MKAFDNKTHITYYDDILLSKTQQERKNTDAKIIAITPREYLEECGKGFGNNFDQQLRQIESDSTINDNLIKLLQEGVKLYLPYLNYTKGIFGQEGRHRMYAAAQVYGWDTEQKCALFTTLDVEVEKEEQKLNYINSIGKLIRRLTAKVKQFSYGSIQEVIQVLQEEISANDDIPEDIKIVLDEKNDKLVFFYNSDYIEEEDIDDFDIDSSYEDSFLATSDDWLDGFSDDDIEELLKKYGM